MIYRQHQDPGKLGVHPDPKSRWFEWFLVFRLDLFTKQIWTDGLTKHCEASSGSGQDGIIGFVAGSGIWTE
jgi:hypothetical protein